MTEISSAVESFLSAKRTARRARRAIDNYRRHMAHFIDWLDRRQYSVTLQETKRATIRQYIDWIGYYKEQYIGHPYKQISETNVDLSPVTVPFVRGRYGRSSVGVNVRNWFRGLPP